MARKQLKRGPNASRVTKRIAEAPHDLSDKNIFTVLKEMEDQEPAPPSFNEKKQKSTIISMPDRRQDTEQAGPPAVSQNRQTSKAQIIPAEQEETDDNDLPQEIVFTEEEKEIIKKAVMDYRNRLPMYLKAMRPKIDAVHRIVKKIKATQINKRRDDDF